jgi:regulator of RNase E activity RraA
MRDDMIDEAVRPHQEGQTYPDTAPRPSRMPAVDGSSTAEELHAPESAVADFPTARPHLHGTDSSGSGLTRLPPTAPLSDALVALGMPLRIPRDVKAQTRSEPVLGRVVGVLHDGSVDVFLEALDRCAPGEVMVVDNEGRDDEACVGDLVALELRQAGLAALVVWGRHRDSAQLESIGLPVFSLGPHPAGPRGQRRRRYGAVRLGEYDLIAADQDGVLLLGPQHRDEVLRRARQIEASEREQAAGMRNGRTLRQQLDFAGYQRRRNAEETYGLRDWLRERGGAVET